MFCSPRTYAQVLKVYCFSLQPWFSKLYQMHLQRNVVYSLHMPRNNVTILGKVSLPPKDRANCWWNSLNFLLACVEILKDYLYLTVIVSFSPSHSDERKNEKKKEEKEGKPTANTTMYLYLFSIPEFIFNSQSSQALLHTPLSFHIGNFFLAYHIKISILTTDKELVILKVQEA